MSAVSTAATTTHCRNCGTFLGEPAGNFCPNCGQDTLNHPPSFWEFIHEFITHYVALEGKLWKTLLLLFFKPAQLTREYREGRKQRYISPLRLYITASFLFFLVFKVFDIGGGSLVTLDGARQPIGKSAAAIQSAKNEQGTPDAPDGPTPQGEKNTDIAPTVRSRVEADVSFAPSAAELAEWKKQGSFNLDCDQQKLSATCHSLEKRLKTKYQDKTDAQMWANIRSGVVSNLPYAIFFSLPFFALLTKLLYIRRGYYFGEHFVYALHIHAFTFFAMLLMAVVDNGVAFGVVSVLAALYYLIGLQRFFGGRWWINVLRYLALAMLYPVFLATVATVLLIAVFLG